MNLHVENLTFHYGKSPILREISFEIPGGTLAALLGPNGSGKTTLLRCLSGFLRPKSGDVRLDGASISSFSYETLARKIAFMPQRCEPSGLTVFEAVLLGRRPTMAGWRPSADDLERVDSTLQRLGLGALAGRPLDRLSGGELQKSALARILVQDAEVLVLDEPTSALDLKNQVEILKTLQNVVRERRILAILSLHDINLGMRFADRLLFLQEGTLLADETPQTVNSQVVTSAYGLPVETLQATKSRVFVPEE